MIIALVKVSFSFKRHIMQKGQTEDGSSCQCRQYCLNSLMDVESVDITLYNPLTVFYSNLSSHRLYHNAKMAVMK